MSTKLPVGGAVSRITLVPFVAVKSDEANLTPLT